MSPEDSLVLFFRDGRQARVPQPADGRVCMVIHNAVEGAVDAVTDIIVKHLVAAGILPHPGAIYVQHQACGCLGKVPEQRKDIWSAGTAFKGLHC